MPMTGEQYTKSLRKLNLVVYLFGERVGNVVDHPLIRPSLNAVAITYDLAHRPEYMELMTAISPLTGRGTEYNRRFLNYLEYVQEAERDPVPLRDRAARSGHRRRTPRYPSF